METIKISSVNGDFVLWLSTLFAIIEKEADLKPVEIAVNVPEVIVYWRDGKTPQEVYFNVWQEDGGNFINL